LHSNYGTGISGGNIQGFHYILYGDQTGGFYENSSYPRSANSPNPQPSQIANFTALSATYNVAITGPDLGTCIFDPWFTIPGVQGGTGGVGYPGDSRTHEFDIGINTPSGTGDDNFSRLFTMRSSNAWDGYPLYYNPFAWRFISARPPVLSGTVNLLGIWRQMVWTGSAPGNEWIVGINFGKEPMFAGIMDITINNFAVTWQSNANITIAANGSATRPGNLGHHIVGAVAGQNSTVDYRPNASTSYSIKRMAGGKTLVRSTDWTTQDQIEGCDSLQFSDGIKTIANIPVVTETALTIPLPYTTNKVIRQLKASGSPTTWSITNGNANGYFAIDTSGNLTLTAAGVAAISPTLVPSYSMGGSFTGSASPGSAFRVYFSSTGYVGRGSVFVDGNTINTTQVSVRIATASSHTSGTLDSVWIGKVAAGVPNQLPNFLAGTAVQATFAGATSVTLAAGANTYISDPITYNVGRNDWLMIGFHTTGSGVRLATGSPSTGATYWANSVSDVASGTFPTATGSSGAYVVGVSEVDVGTTNWYDVEVKATNANNGHAGVGAISIGSPLFAAFSSSSSANITLSNGGSTAQATTASPVGDIAAATPQSFTLNIMSSGRSIIDSASSVAVGFVNDLETLTNTRHSQHWPNSDRGKLAAKDHRKPSMPPA
jgi:hypothetical protein